MALDSETFSALRASVQRFIRERLIPNEDRVENEDDIPQEIIREMRELGLFGLSMRSIPSSIWTASTSKCETVAYG